MFGPHQEAVNPDDYVDGKLWLISGNSVTPHSSLLIYRLSQGDETATVNIDEYHLSNILRLIGRQTSLILQVGNA